MWVANSPATLSHQIQWNKIQNKEIKVDGHGRAFSHKQVHKLLCAIV